MNTVKRLLYVLIGVVAFLVAAAFTPAAVLVAIGFAIGATTIAALSLKYGEKTWNRLDVVCLISAGISILIWPLMKSALIVMLINLFMSAVGAIPTLKKAYRSPASEDKLAWGLFVVSSLFNLVAIKEWKFAIAIYPIAIALIDGSIAAVVFWPRNPPTPRLRRTGHP